MRRTIRRDEIHRSSVDLVCLFFRPYAGAYNRLIQFFLFFFLADLSYVGFVLVGDFLDIQR